MVVLGSLESWRSDVGDDLHVVAWEAITMSLPTQIRRSR